MQKIDQLVNLHVDITELTANSFETIETVFIPREKIQSNEGDLIGNQFDISFNLKNKLKEALDSNSKYFILSFESSSYLCTCIERRFKSATVQILCPIKDLTIPFLVFSEEENEKINSLFQKMVILSMASKAYQVDKEKIKETKNVLAKENRENIFVFWFIFLRFTTRGFRSKIEFDFFFTEDFQKETFKEILNYFDTFIGKIEVSQKNANNILEKNIVDKTDVVEELKVKFENLDKEIPEEIRDIFNKELNKLRYLNPMSPDYSNQIEYLETITEIPWGSFHGKETDISEIFDILNASHYGLSSAKTAITEHLALQQWTKESHGQIICLIGPPGTGKSSIANTIADSLNRKFIKMALGGLGDESELRGHRKTYVSASPGRIIKELIRIGSLNPVIVLDEIDKLQAHRGSPADALLEILDPEQNTHFVDRYLGFSLDISKCLFICTANYKDQIPEALLDRMEVIDLAGYTKEEQQVIARDYLVPKYKNRWNLNNITISEDILEFLSSKKKTGMRDFEREIQKILKKSVYTILTKKVDMIELTKENITETIGYNFPIPLTKTSAGY